MHDVSPALYLPEKYLSTKEIIWVCCRLFFCPQTLVYYVISKWRHKPGFWGPETILFAKHGRILTYFSEASVKGVIADTATQLKWRNSRCFLKLKWALSNPFALAKCTWCWLRPLCREEKSTPVLFMDIGQLNSTSAYSLFDILLIICFRLLLRFLHWNRLPPRKCIDICVPLGSRAQLVQKTLVPYPENSMQHHRLAVSHTWPTF